MKSIVLASIAIAIGMVAFTASAVATHGHQHGQDKVKGTGRAGGSGNWKCQFCNGTGWNGSY